MVIEFTTAGYQEVLPDQALIPSRWREIFINVGSSRGTLDEIRVSEFAGGAAYKDLSHPVIHNRIMYWRGSGETLEFLEISLNLQLEGNSVQLVFQGSPVLDGVTFHEAGSCVVLLVPTVSSIHRIVRPHPVTLSRQLGNLESQWSVLHDLQVEALKDVHHNAALHAFSSSLEAGLSQPLPHVAASTLTSEGNAVFAFGYPSGLILVVTMGADDGAVTCLELKASSFVSRFWTGLKNTFTMSSHSAQEAPISLLLHEDHSSGELLLLVLSCDAKLRIWKALEEECILSMVLPGGVPSSLLEGAAQRFRLQAVKGTNDLFVSHYPIQHKDLVSIFSVKSGRTFSVEFNQQPELPENTVVIDSMFTQDNAWVLCTDTNEHLQLYHCAHKCTHNWVSVNIEPMMPSAFPYSPGELDDPQTTCLLEIFQSGRISPLSVWKAVGMYQDSETPPPNWDVISNLGHLQAEVVDAVERKVTAQCNGLDLSDEELSIIVFQCWADFYLLCAQYQSVEGTALGLHAEPNSDVVSIIRRGSVSLVRPLDMLEAITNSKGRDVSKIAQVLPGCELLPMASAAIGGSCLEPELSVDAIKSLNAVIEEKAGDVISLVQKLQASLYVEGVEDMDREEGNGVVMGSKYGVSLLVRTTQQIVQARLESCRLLHAVAHHVVHRLADLHETFAEDTPQLMRTYALLTWATQQVSSIPEKSSRAILELFLESIIQDMPLSVSQKLWNQDLGSLLHQIFLLISPTGSDSLFADFLLKTQEYFFIQKYCQQVRDMELALPTYWKMILGKALLGIEDFEQAKKELDLTPEELARDPEIASTLIRPGEEVGPQRLYVMYCKTVIRDLERYQVPELVIEVVNWARAVAAHNDPDVPALHSLAFKHYMKQEKYIDAYREMMGNPDATQRSTCLQDLVATLCSRNELQCLLSFSYEGVRKKVADVLEWRARNCDLSTNYYLILHAFFGLAGDYRRAAMVMYDYAQRLSDELFSLERLQKQFQAYLYALNNLHLCPPDYNFMVGTSEQEDVKVISISDLQKEYLLIKAKIQICKTSPEGLSLVGSSFTPKEVIGLLLKNRLYDEAIKLSCAFSCSHVPIIETLTTRCIEASGHSWKVKGVEEEREIWRLLEDTVQKLEKKGDTTLHAAAVKRFLSLNAVIPRWLYVSYFEKNAGSLLYLYFQYGFMCEATELACHIMDVTIAKPKQKPYSVCLPTVLIDQLHAELSSHPDLPLIQELCQTLEVKITEYEKYLDA